MGNEQQELMEDGGRRAAFVGGNVNPAARENLLDMADKTHRNQTDMLEHLLTVCQAFEVHPGVWVVISLEDPKRTPPEMRRCDSCGEGVGDA